MTDLPRFPENPRAALLALLERIAIALEELVEVQRTQPLEKIIHPSMRRPTVEELVTDGDEK